MRPESQASAERLEQLARWRVSAAARVANYRANKRGPMRAVLLEELDFSLEQVQVAQDELRRVGEELARARSEVELLRRERPLGPAV